MLRNFFITLLLTVFLSITSFSFAETLKFNGGIYEGEVTNGKANGKGTFVFSDGSKYEGQFQNDKIAGDGKYTDLNNSVFQGTWKNGRLTNKIDQKTREKIFLNPKKSPVVKSEIKGEGAGAADWFEAQKNSSGVYELTAKGKSDMAAKTAAANKSSTSSSSGGGC